MAIGKKVKGFIKKAQDKYEEKATSIRQRKNEAFAKDLKELRKKRLSVEGHAKLIEQKRIEQERITKATRTINQERPVVKGLKKLAGAVGEVRKHTTNDFGAKNKRLERKSFDDSKLRL